MKMINYDQDYGLARATQLCAIKQQLDLPPASFTSWRDHVMFDVLVYANLAIPEMVSLKTAPFDRNLESRQKLPLPVTVWNFAVQRVVEFSPELVEELKSFVALCRDLRVQKTDALFTTEKGEKLTAPQGYAIFKSAARKAGIRGIPIMLQHYKPNSLV
jgi:site-specific recombinase XerD